MTAQRVLRAAAFRLEIRGWMQGGYCSIKESQVHTRPSRTIGATDLTGAIRAVCGGHWNGESDDAKAEAKEAVRAVVGGGSLADWNDEPGRTISDVTAVLRAAANNCRTIRYEAKHITGWLK